MTYRPEDPDLQAIARGAEAELEAAEAVVEATGESLQDAGIVYYEAELRSLRDAALVEDEAERRDDRPGRGAQSPTD